MTTLTNSITRDLVAAMVAAYRDGVPEALLNEGRKGLLNALGLTIGASHEEGINAIIRNGSPGDVPLPGRSDKADFYTAAEAVAAGAHWEDFDDGHDFARIHPGPSAVGAVFTTGALLNLPAVSVIAGHAISGEVQFRLGVCEQPEHYVAGWHTTGAVGAIANAIAVGCLLGADEKTIETAVSLAAAQAAGIRQGFGTMMKPMNAGKAAANGVLAIRLAMAGASAPVGLLEGPGGFLEAFSSNPTLNVITDGLGTEWLYLGNTYKPYPCGRVLHPIIDAALDLLPELGGVDQLVSAEVECHPYVESLTGIPNPQTGLETKFSTSHSVAVALVRGQASTTEYSDEAALDPAVDAVRRKVTLLVRPDDGPGTWDVTLRLLTKDGRRLEQRVTEARGTIARPLTFEDIQRKASQLIEPILPGRGEKIATLVGELSGNDPISQLTELATA